MSENDRTALWIALGGAVVLYFWSRTSQGESAVASVADSVGGAVDEVGNVVNQTLSAVRGIRNNNPGNIRKNSTPWRGLSVTQTDPAFFQFTSMPYGVRAMGVILRTYQEKYGLTTVSDIINRWAPPTENDTGAYVSNVADALGVDASESIDVHDAPTLAQLVRAIVHQENGPAGALVSDVDIANGVSMALA